MVVLRQLVAKDFKHLNVDFTFPHGILAISGANESGKSSIFEAILYAFFGRTNKAPMGEKKRLINFDANELFVSLTFEIEGKLYRVSRRVHEKRPSQVTLNEVSKSGQLIPLAKGSKNVDKEISELLNGVSLSDFLAANVVLQKDLDRLSKLVRMDRRNVINAMMGRDCFSQAVEKLQTNLRPLNEIIQKQREALQDSRYRKKQFLDDTQEYEEKQKELVSVEKQLKELSQLYEKLTKEFKVVKVYKEAKDEKDKIQIEFNHKKELKNQQEQQLARLNELKTRQEELLIQEERLSFLDDDLQRFEEIKDLTDQLQEINNEKQKTSETISELQNKLAELANLDKVVFEYNQVKNKRIKLETSQRQLFSPLLYIPSIGLLSAGIMAIFFNLLLGIALLLGSIPFIVYLGKTFITYRSAGPELDNLRAKEEDLYTQISPYFQKQDFEEQMKNRLDKNSELTSELTNLTEGLYKLLTKLSPAILNDIPIPSSPDAPSLIHAKEAVQQKITKLQANKISISNELNSITSQLSGVNELVAKLAKNDEAIDSLHEKLSSLKLPDLPPEIPKFSEKRFEELEKQYQSVGQKRASYEERQENISQRLDDLSVLLDKNSGILEEFAKKEEELATLDENVKSGKLTIELIRKVAERGREQVRPRVVQVMERLLAAITDGKYRFPKLREDYSLKVYSAEAGEYVDANLYSGGTEDQFLLALRLGFAIALLPQGRGTTPQFLLLDEPFGGSDIQRRDNIIKLLQDELSRTFQQIIVVSHQSAVLSASEHRFRMVNGRLIHSE